MNSESSERKESTTRGLNTTEMIDPKMTNTHMTLSNKRKVVIVR